MRCKCWQCMKHDREAVGAFAAGPPAMKAMKAMKAAKKKVSARLATAMKKLVGGRLAKRHVSPSKESQRKWNNRSRGWESWQTSGK